MKKEKIQRNEYNKMQNVDNVLKEREEMNMKIKVDEVQEVRKNVVNLDEKFKYVETIRMQERENETQGWNGYRK